VVCVSGDIHTFDSSRFGDHDFGAIGCSVENFLIIEEEYVFWFEICVYEVKGMEEMESM